MWEDRKDSFTWKVPNNVVPITHEIVTKPQPAQSVPVTVTNGGWWHPSTEDTSANVRLTPPPPPPRQETPGSSDIFDQLHKRLSPPAHRRPHSNFLNIFAFFIKQLSPFYSHNNTIFIFYFELSKCAAVWEHWARPWWRLLVLGYKMNYSETCDNWPGAPLASSH